MNTVEKIQQEMKAANEFVSKLIPEVREEAFRILLSLFRDTHELPAKRADATEAIAGDNTLAFFENLEIQRPSGAALAIAAYYYSKYGTSPLTVGKAREIANRVGLTVPDKIDMTYRAAQRSGKKLFTGGKAGFLPTVHGEIFFRETFGVLKGTHKPPEEDAA